LCGNFRRNSRPAPLRCLTKARGSPKDPRAFLFTWV
jgi:hypothetical protein